MKRPLILLACLGVLAIARAQEPPAYDPVAAARERARIEAERAQVQARYERDQEACYQRFAVNDCLRESRVRRRAVLEELRRQEIKLNDAQRASTAAEQARRTAEKAEARESEEQAAQRAAAKQAQKERLERAEQKKAERAGRASPKARAASDAPAPKADSSAARGEAKKAYEEKLKQAQERKSAQDKAQAEKAGRTARPLPVPP